MSSHLALVSTLPREVPPTTVSLAGLSDDDLIGRARAGDLAAFEAIYRRHVDRVLGLCLRMTCDRSRAEDLTQEAFLRAWRKLASFAGRSSFSTWLHRLTVNVAVAAFRRERRWTDRLTGLDEAPPAEAPASPQGARLDLRQAIAALPPQARLVFVLYDVEGYRHREIAALTGLSEGTSKAHLHRARRRLREALAG